MIQKNVQRLKKDGFLIIFQCSKLLNSKLPLFKIQPSLLSYRPICQWNSYFTRKFGTFSLKYYKFCFNFDFQNICDTIYIISSMRTTTKTVSQDLARLSLINNLKLKIQSLKHEVQQQKKIIEGYKKSTKITLLNEQQVQIQKLNDENKRLLLIIQEMKTQNIQPIRKVKGLKFVGRSSQMNHIVNKKNSVNEEMKENVEEEKKQGRKENKRVNFQQKYYQVLMENEKMRKQLIVLRANENLIKHKKPFNDSTTILMEKNINEIDKIKQKNYQLEVELSNWQQKSSHLKQRVTELEEMLEKAMQISKSMKIL